jgi:hypothetical protein
MRIRVATYVRLEPPKKKIAKIRHMQFGNAVGYANHPGSDEISGKIALPNAIEIGHTRRIA